MNGIQSMFHLTGLESRRGKHGLVCERSPSLLGIAGFDGKLKFLSPAWKTILGYRWEELLNRPLCELMQHNPAVAVVLVDQLLAEDGIERMEFGLKCKDGTCKRFLWHRRFDSENQAIFIAGYDITEQKGRQTASMPRSCEQAKRAHRAH